MHKALLPGITKCDSSLEESTCAGVCICKLTYSLFPGNIIIFYWEEQLTDSDDQTWNLADISRK